MKRGKDLFHMLRLMCPEGAVRGKYTIVTGCGGRFSSVRAPFCFSEMTSPSNVNMSKSFKFSSRSGLVINSPVEGHFFMRRSDTYRNEI